MFVLEAYDKDNDVYVAIHESDSLDELKTLGKTLWSSFCLTRKDNDEPIDWLVISDKSTGNQVACITDED